MLESLGLLGLFVGCALAATIVPFSSEALFAGALLMDRPVWLVLLVAAAGNTVGGMVSYAMGWLCKWSWLERWFRVDRARLDKMHHHVERYGLAAAAFTWLPVVGDLIAIALGLARANPAATVLLMFGGKLARYAVVAGLMGAIGLT